MKILIMLHGYGSNYNDLISLSDFFGDDYLYISIQANHSLDLNSYCWWSLHYDSNNTLKSDSCPQFSVRQIMNVKNCQSPEKIIKRFGGSGLKVISALVDLSLIHI